MSDNEIDDLDDLDSLLDELGDDLLNEEANKVKPQEGEKKEQIGTSQPTTDNEINSDDPTSSELDAMLKEMREKDPLLAAQLGDFVKELQKEELQKDLTKPTTSTSGPTNFEDIVTDTINRLKTSGDDVDKQLKEEQKLLENQDPLSLLLSQMGDLDLGDLDGDGDGGFGGVLQEMLSQLTSKNVLYEPLKDVHTKFKKWLPENAPPKVEAKQYENYEKQYKVIEEIVLKFESADYDDKTDSLYINERLEQLQDLGTPPEQVMDSDLGQMGIFGGGPTPQGSSNELDIEKQLEDTCLQQ